MRSVVLQGKAQLPTYDEAPAYIAPACCRLCMGPCREPEEQNGPAHRRDVLEPVMAEGPVAVGAQVIRARLTALPERWTRREEAA